MRLAKRGCIVLFVCTLTYAGVALLSDQLASWVFMPKLKEVSQKMHSHQQEILADLKLLDAQAIFADSTRKNNAQEFISQAIPWEGLGRASVATPTQRALKELQAAYPRWAEVDTLRKLAADPRLTNIDVAWMDELEAFDHWNLASFSEVKDRFARLKQRIGMERIRLLTTIPQPDFGIFHFAAVLRFLQLEKSGDTLKGLKLFRHSLYLAHTTATYIGAMIAAAGLERENLLVQAFAVKDGAPIEKERILAYKRVAWAWGALIHEASWGTLPSEFEQFIKPRNAVCATAGEMAFYSGVYQEFLKPNLPLENNFTSVLQKNADINRKILEVCSLPEYLYSLEPVQTGSEQFFARLPFVRKIYRLNLLTFTMPNFLGKYQDRTPSSAKAITK